jgi:hypothetical protein
MFSAGSYQLTVYFILSPLRTKKGGDNQGYTTGLSCMSAIEPGWGSVLFNNVSFSSFNGAIFTTGIRIILFHSNSHTEEKNHGNEMVDSITYLTRGGNSRRSIFAV